MSKQADRIIRRAGRGESLNHIADSLGISREEMRLNLLEAGALPVSAIMRPWYTEADAILGEVTDRTIAETFGVTKRQVVARRRELGIPGARSSAIVEWRLLGSRHGRLVVKERMPDRSWRCECDCGGTTYIKGTQNVPRTKSCGCLRREYLNRNRKEPTDAYQKPCPRQVRRADRDLHD